MSIEKLLRSLSGWLPSQRPRALQMTSSAATGLVDTTLFLVTVLERASIRYVINFGTLLGAHRLHGLLPWDDDVDIYFLDESSASVRQKIEPILLEHGLEMIYDPRDFFWVRQRPWFAGSGHIGLSPLLASPTADDPIQQGPHEQRITPEELYPLVRYSFYGSPVWGPQKVEAILSRLYGPSGQWAVMARFQAAPITPAAQSFWTSQRPSQEALDWPAVSARLLGRRRFPFLSWLGLPWWWFNGAYLLLVRWASAKAKAELERRVPQ